MLGAVRAFARETIVIRSAKWCIEHAVRNPLTWKILDATLVPAARYATWVHESHQCSLQRPEEDIAAKTRSVIPELTVRHGPFAGMRYPAAESVGSALFPKLLGSYEQELHPWVERLCHNHYTEVVDVGCAEGYYAVGLALRLPGARVYAFDVSPHAMRRCADMARLNGVLDRVTIGGGVTVGC